MKKIKTGHLLIFGFILIISLLFISNYLNNKSISDLKNNGVETYATISKIEVNNYRANEMDGTMIENYIFTFNFQDNGENIKSIRTIEKKEYSKFFNKKLYVNDTISIIYDPKSPKNNKIKELKL